MITVASAIEKFSTQVDEHHDRQASVPITSGLARQGDVIVVPAGLLPGLAPAKTYVPSQGVPVVRGESGGNTHLLLADGAVFFDWADRSDETELALGTLTVAEGSTGFLAHPEHSFVGFAPGTYQIRRQREQADVIRLVAD